MQAGQILLKQSLTDGRGVSNLATDVNLYRPHQFYNDLLNFYM